MNRNIRFHLPSGPTDWYSWDDQKDLIEKFFRKAEFKAIEIQEMMTRQEYQQKFGIIDD